MNNDQFYRQCADLLGIRYECTGFPYSHRTRWNNRAPGHGRFPGHGIIRAHGSEIHMSLRHPISVNRRFSSPEEALSWLSQALTLQP